jgi:acyl-CoA thioesterase I
MITKSSVLALALSGIAAFEIVAQPAVQIHWSAVGNSITANSGYTGKLEKLLGPAYKVENDGVSGCTMLKKGNTPYWTRGKFTQVWAFKPDIVSIKLGTNDSKPVNWNTHKGEFLADTRAMIDTLAGLASKPLLFPCYPVPAFQKNGAWSVDGINDPVIKDEIMPKIKQAADEKGLTVMDLHTPLEKRGDLFETDGVHPDAGESGADSIAVAMFRTYKSKVTRIACVGNSITDNSHDANAYPIKFNQLMGRDFYVFNAGHSGRTLLRKGDSPYAKSPYLDSTFKFKPNVITIKLGTNDSKPQNWDSHKGEFVTDLRWLIDTLSTIIPKPRIILCTPIPAWKKADGTEAYDIRNAVIRDEIIPKIKQVAEEKGLTLLDLYTGFLPYEKLTSDGVHPTAVGQDTLAHILMRAYKSSPPVALTSPKGPSEIPSGSHLQLGLKSSEVRFSDPKGMLYKTTGQTSLGPK